MMIQKAKNYKTTLKLLKNFKQKNGEHFTVMPVNCSKIFILD